MEFSLNISLSDTIFVIASGIPNSEIVTKKLNKLVIRENDPKSVVPILFVMYTLVIISTILIIAVENVSNIKFFIKRDFSCIFLSHLEF